MYKDTNFTIIVNYMTKSFVDLFMRLIEKSPSDYSERDYFVEHRRVELPTSRLRT